MKPGHRTPSLHQPTLSRRSSISAGHGGERYRDVDVSQIGKPVVTPRKERPSHQRSLTGRLTRVGRADKADERRVVLSRSAGR